MPQNPASQVHALLGSGRLHACHRLAVEHRPADVVSQSLIIQDKVADRFRQLLALPLAFPTTSGLALPLWRGCPHGLDCVGRSAELVGGNMRHRRRLARSVGGVPSALRPTLWPQRWRSQRTYALESS